MEFISYLYNKPGVDGQFCVLLSNKLLTLDNIKKLSDFLNSSAEKYSEQINFNVHVNNGAQTRMNNAIDAMQIDIYYIYYLLLLLSYLFNT